MGLNVVAIIGQYFLIESPAWLVSVGESKLAQDSVSYVARFNGVANFCIGNIVPDKKQTIENEETKPTESD